MSWDITEQIACFSISDQKYIDKLKTCFILCKRQCLYLNANANVNVDVEMPMPRFQNGLKAPHICISKSSSLQIFYKGRSFQKFHKNLPEFLCNKIAGVIYTLFILRIDFSTSVYLRILRTFSEDLTLLKNFKEMLLEMLFITLLNDCFYIYEDSTFMRWKHFRISCWTCNFVNSKIILTETNRLLG